MWDVARELADHEMTEDGSGAGSSTGGSGADESSSFKQQIVIPLAVLILILYVVLGHSLELWKDAHKAGPGQRGGFVCTFHESGPAILLGLAVGLMVNYGVGQQFDFNADVFFYVVLPPIIFHQGYALKKRNFFKYFHYIFSFGFLGTLIQFITITVLALYASNSKYLGILRDDGVPIGLSLHECMLMAAVFSAADEVATLSLIKQAEFPKLSAVLFGEGVLNDAMSILLFQTVQSGEEGESSAKSGSGSSSGTGKMELFRLLAQAMYILVSAAGVGMGSGLMISKLLKSLDTLKSSPVRQVAILMLGGYLSFSLSEALELSGILAVFFCGLTLSHYAWHSLGENAQVASKITSETISMIAEAYCFVAIGLSVHDFDASQWCWGFIVAMVLVLMTARALSVYGICLGGRMCFPKSFSMPVAEQHVLFFGGLVRGAIAWAQVVQVSDPHRGLMVTTSLGVIVFTTVFFGAVMPFFTRGLKPERSEPPPSAFQYQLEGDSVGGGNSYYDPYSVTMDNMSVFSAASSVVNPSSVRGIVHRLWNDFDNRFMRGVFGGKPHENINVFDANPFNSAYSSAGGPNSIGVSASGIPAAIPPYQFNPALNPGEHMPLPTSPVRRANQHPPTQHLFPLSENSAINPSINAAGGGRGGDKADHGTFAGGREETKTGDVAAVPPKPSTSGGQPV
ncbi:unnamed protein product [Pylaiella littoralis]